MPIGFIADNADTGYFVQGRWVEGLPVNARFFGMDTGGLNIKGRQTFPLLAYRCPSCSGVELFAVNEEQAREVLLRPPMGGEAQPSDQLPRGSEAPDPES